MLTTMPTMPNDPTPADRAFAAYLLEELLPELDDMMPSELRDITPELRTTLLEGLWHARGLARLSEQPANFVAAIEELQAVLERAPIPPCVPS